MGMTTIARHLLIKGRVQGVFYRGWTVETARSLGLSGWVRNRQDGSVEALVQGEPETIAHLIVLARRGPMAARVDEIVETIAEVEAIEGFEQRATA